MWDEDELRALEGSTENAKDSINEIKEKTTFLLDSLERIGGFSQRTASVSLGLAAGIILGTVAIISCQNSSIKISRECQVLLLGSLGLGGASAGALLKKESQEDKARRIENAVIRMGRDPMLQPLRANLYEQHEKVTGSLSQLELERLIGESKDLSLTSINIKNTSP
jgi:hypothetical protein